MENKMENKIIKIKKDKNNKELKELIKEGWEDEFEEGLLKDLEKEGEIYFRKLGREMDLRGRIFFRGNYLYNKNNGERMVGYFRKIFNNKRYYFYNGEEGIGGYWKRS